MEIQAPPVEGKHWLNGPPIIWDSLRGQAIVVVFWALADQASLARLLQVERLCKDSAEVTAIGVHTPRVPCEDELENVESVIAQHRISMPIVHDPDYTTWNRYNPEGWPTTMVVDHKSNIVGAQPGAEAFEVVEQAVSVSVRVAQNRGGSTLAPPAATSAELPPFDALAFPTCVHDLGSDFVAIADFAHDRVVLVRLHLERSGAEVVEIAKMADSPYAITTSAHKPNLLYISQPSAGTVVRYDRATNEQHTVVNGLIWPTGLTMDRDGSLVIAESGTGSILRVLSPDSPGEKQYGTIASQATHEESGLCQPIAFARTEVGLALCDSTASSLRLLTDRGKLTTIVGDGVFEWGLVDGPVHQARVQQPCDLDILPDGSIVVADTGNNRLRRLSQRRIKTLGVPGLERPSGVCALPSGHVLVADTGNSRIALVDPKLQSAHTLTIGGLPPTESGNQSAEKETSIGLPNGKADPADRTVAAHQKIVIGYPAPDNGPWRVQLTAEPMSLLSEPVDVIRNSSTGKISAMAGAAGSGVVTVLSSLVTDADVAEAHSFSLCVTEASPE